MKLKILLITFFSILINHLYCQSISELKKSSDCRNDTCFINYINKISFDSIETNTDYSYQLTLKSINLSRKNNYKKGLATAMYNLAYNLDLKQKYKEALDIYKLSFNIFNQLNDSTYLAKISLNIGIINSNMGDIPLSLKYYNEALIISEKINDSLLIAKTYSNIGVSYYYKSDYSKAVEFYLKALKIFEDKKDTLRVITLLNNLSAFYSYKKATNKVFEVLNRALTLAFRYNDASLLADTYNNFASEYIRNNNLEKASEFQQKSLEYYQKVNNIRGVMTCYNNFGEINVKLKKFKDAVNCYKKILEIADNSEMMSDMPFYLRSLAVSYFYNSEFSNALNTVIKSTELAKRYDQKKIVLDNYYLMADIYKSIKKYEKSSDCLFNYVSLNDSILLEEYQNSVAEMDAKYESEKKAKEITLLKKDQVLKDNEIKHQKTIRTIITIGLILVVILILFVLYNYIQKKKANVILIRQKKEIEEKNEELNQQKEEIITQRDEIEAQRDLVTVQKEQIEIIHKEVSDSINYATRLQAAVLPDVSILQKYFSDCFILFKPKDKVSGDFYWWAEIENNIVITVADCTGHGVPGAFMSMLGSSLLREIVVKEYITSPAIILKRLRKEIIKALKQKGVSGEQKDGMDISLITINTETNECQWAGANNPLYVIARSETSKQSVAEVASLIVRNDDIELCELKGDKMPIAIHERMDPFINHEFKITKGDCLYLFSDGFADQFGGPKGKKFMYKQFKELFLTNCQKSMQKQKEIIEKVINEWIGEGEQVDDITVLGIKI